MNKLLAEDWYNQGLAHHTQGEIALAQAAYEHAIALTPLPEAYSNLGLIYQAQGQNEQAIQAYSNAVLERPNYSPALLNLGVLYKQQGHLEHAMTTFQQIIQHDPNHAKAHANLGNIYRELNQLKSALYHHEIAYQLAPKMADIQTNLGCTLLALKRFDDARHTLESAIALKPNGAEAYSNLAIVHQHNRDYLKATELCLKAIQLDPNNAKYHFNLGMTYYNNRQFDPALKHYQVALTFDPNNPEIHLAKAFIHLINGDFKIGWQEYEWRLKANDKPLKRSFSQPRWSGQTLKNKRLLVHAEQGLGDALQFIRFAASLKPTHTTIIVDCQQELQPIITRVVGVDEVIHHHQPLPPYDYWIPLLSIPGVLGITLETIPNQVPYLKPEAKSFEFWQTFFKSYSGPKIGLCWAGNPNQKNDFNRSATLADFAPILNLKRINYFSLQIGERNHEMDLSQTPIVDLNPNIHSYDDTLSIIANLDAVVSVCTSVAHAAGALNKPTFVALCYGADWRWFLHRTDSPWYPSARLYRQMEPGQWKSVFDRIAEDLRTSYMDPGLVARGKRDL